MEEGKSLLLYLTTVKLILKQKLMTDFNNKIVFLYFQRILRNNILLRLASNTSLKVWLTLLSYTPLSKDQGFINMATCIDLKISILPKFILNKTARIFAFDYFNNMINTNKKFENTPW